MLVVDKPRGLTSHDVVARARRALGTREIGHAGTLDPMATGVLVLAIGEATKLVPWLTALDKSYEATIALGVETDTLDADGAETARAAIPDDVRALLARSSGAAGAPPLCAALDRERARSAQVPPAFSAIRTGGERAFARARRGEAVALAERDVAVRRLEVVGWSAEPPELHVVLDVAKGYYVRSLARDLSAGLGTVGHLRRLRRTQSGNFTSDEALPLDGPPENLRAAILPPAVAASRALPAGRLTDAGVRDARHGRPVQPGDHDAPPSTVCAWLDAAGALVAVGRVDGDGRGTVLRGFAPAAAL